MYRFLSLLLLVGMMQEIHSGECFFLQIAADYTTELSIDKDKPSKEELADIIESLNTTLEMLYSKLNNNSTGFDVLITYDRVNIATGRSSCYRFSRLPGDRIPENIDSFHKCVQGIIANLSQ